VKSSNDDNVWVNPMDKKAQWHDAKGAEVPRKLWCYNCGELGSHFSPSSFPSCMEKGASVTAGSPDVTDGDEEKGENEPERANGRRQTRWTRRLSGTTRRALRFPASFGATTAASFPSCMEKGASVTAGSPDVTDGDEEKGENEPDRAPRRGRTQTLSSLLLFTGRARFLPSPHPRL
jgi:hypothetical protein